MKKKLQRYCKLLEFGSASCYRTYRSSNHYYMTSSDSDPTVTNVYMTSTCTLYILCFCPCTACIQPPGVPEMFVAVAGERQVTFSWSPPPVALRNGVITSYTLSCSPSPSSLPQSPSQPGTLTVSGFSPDTSYSCSVVASNSQGSGPPASISFTTQQDCETD